VRLSGRERRRGAALSLDKAAGETGVALAATWANLAGRISAHIGGCHTDVDQWYSMKWRDVEQVTPSDAQ
jgi:hypothetical protein